MSAMVNSSVYKFTMAIHKEDGVKLFSVMHIERIKGKKFKNVKFRLSILKFFFSMNIFVECTMLPRDVQCPPGKILKT